MKVGIRFLAFLLVAMMLSGTFMAVTGSPDGWPMYRGDIYGRAQSPYDVSDNPGEVVYHHFPYGEPVGAPIVTPDGTVILSTDAGLEAIKDGNKVWNFTYPYVIQNPGSYVSASPPAMDRYGNIYVGALQEQRLYAFKPNGENSWVVNWTYDTGNYQGFSSILPDNNGHIFYGSEWEMVALTTSGQKMWSITGKQPYFSIRPSVYGSTVYYAKRWSGSLADRAQVYAVDIPTGRVLWNWSLPEKERTIVSTPLISSNGTVFVLSDSGMLYGILDNSTVMSFNVGSPGSLAMDSDGNLYVSGGNSIYVWYSNGTFHRKMDFPLAVGPFALDSRGNIVALMWNYTAYEIDLASITPDGQMRWNISIAATDQNPFEAVIGPDGTIYVAIDYYGELFAIGNAPSDDGSGDSSDTGGDGSGTDSGGGVDDGATGDDTGDTGGNSTPGFEALLIFTSLAAVFLLRRRH